MGDAGKKVASAVSAVLRTASICMPFSICAAPTVLAEPGGLAVIKADIPAQSLARALQAIAEQTGLELAYVAAVVRDKRSRAVTAGLPVGQALLSMLNGTGLKFEYITPTSIRILGIPPTSFRPASAAAEGAFPDVIVTANRRDEALQNVPITLEVLTGARLSNLNATTFEDFMGELPTVTAHGVGPAQNNIYVRGLATGEYPNQAAGTNGVFPNVAIYLDEQSAQLPGRNLDVYAVDLERIEVLEGPQGTLFGAGAQAGVLRYITNHPKIDVTEGEVNATAAMTAHGAGGRGINGVINLPLIPDRLAVRAVIYNERRGGYIDNTLATFARANTDRSINYANYPVGCGATGAPACQVPPNSVVINNSSLVANDINPVTYNGLRIEALLQFHDDWTVLLAQSYQAMEADGVFAEEAVNALGESQRRLTVQLFNESYNKDRFENTALTIAGRLGDIKLLYAGSYLVRNVEQVQDYTNYARGAIYVDYYQCVNPGASAASARCFSPSSTWHDRTRNTHLSQELRLSTPDEWQIRGVGGLFYEDYKIHDQGDWYYLTALPYFSPIGPPTGYFTGNDTFVPYPVTSNNPNVRALGDGFFNDVTRGYTQKAAFASIDMELVPQRLSVTAGTRYFDTRDTEVGAEVTSFGCRLYDNSFPPPVSPCIDHSYFINLNALGLARGYAGFRSRGNLSWRPNNDLLLYYTWSQGFRAGGYNRSSGPPTYSPLFPMDHSAYQTQARENGGWSPPRSYAPDNLTNNEVGWKSRWLDERLEWNGAIYQEDWAHAQYSLDAALLGGATLNGGNYRVRGFETTLRSRISNGLTLEAGGAWNHSELVRETTFYWADGKPIDFRLLQIASGETLSNPAGVRGSPLAGAPSLRGHLSARYETDFGSYHSFAQIGTIYQSRSLANTDRLGLDLQGTHTAYTLPSFISFDAALGFGVNSWLVQLNGENLSDTRAQLYANYSLNYEAITISRPRTLGLRVSYKFRGA